MKKENLIGILMYLLVFAVALIYGFTVLQTHFTSSSFVDKPNPVLLYALYILGSVAAGVIATGLLEGIGHLLGAKVGGYNIVSACLFYFTFYKDKGKLKFKFASYDGLTGETKITPNYEKRVKPNPFPFLIYGTVFNVAWVVACVVTFFTFYKNKGFYGDLAYLFLTMGIIASLCTIYNIVPVKMDSENDGFRLVKAKRDVEGFNQLLASESGVEVSKDNNDNPELDIKKPAKFIPEVAVSELSELLENEQYEEVFELINKIKEHENDLSKRLQLETSAQYIYATYMSKEKQEFDIFYDKDVSFQLRRDLSNEYTLPAIRTYLLLAGIMDGSHSECLIALKKVLKAYKSLPANRKHSELILFNKTLDLVIDAHPKWEELPNYKLYE